MGLANQYGDLALESTLSALKSATDNLLLAAGSIKTATEAISTKTTKADTDHVAGTVAVSNQPTQPLTDTQLRETDVKVTLDGEQVTVSNFPANQPVSGSVSVSNMVEQGLTDAELRATALPISGTIAVSNQLAQPLTDTQLRASALAVAVNNSNLAAEESIQELQAIEQRLKTLNANIQRLSFDATSQMRVLVSSLPTLSTVTTVGTVTTCNNGFGDAGKASASILTAFQAFQLGVGANFSRS